MAEIEKKISDDNNSMDLTLHINKEELGKAILEIVAENLLKEHSYEMSEMRKGIKVGTQEVVKEMIYSRKDEIIEEVVKRATTEIVRKGVPKLLERM